MGWVTFAARTIALKAAYTDLNNKLMQVNRRRLSQQREASYKTSMFNSNKNEVMSYINNKYTDQINALSSQAQNANSKNATKINSQITELQQAQLAEKEYYESLFARQEEQLQDECARAEKEITMEQEQLQIQVEAAKAEYDAVKEACNNNIKEDTPKFA